MKSKKLLILIFAGMLLMAGKCKKDGEEKTVPDGQNKPNDVATFSSYVKLGEVDFHCDGSPNLDNPCNSVLMGYGNGKLQVRVVGTYTSWEQITQWEAQSIYPTYQGGSLGTQVNYDNEMYTDGCIYFEYPVGEAFNVYIDFIEGENLDCSPTAGTGCWNWHHEETVPENFITYLTCGGTNEHVIDISAVTPTKGNCNF